MLSYHSMLFDLLVHLDNVPLNFHLPCSRQRDVPPPVLWHTGNRFVSFFLTALVNEGAINRNKNNN